MNRKKPHLRRTLAASVLAVAGLLVGVLGCKAIADIPDVTYSARCDEYCNQEFDVCPPPYGQYEDRVTCMQVCSVLDKNANGATSEVGNTVPCRQARLRQAAQAQKSGSAADVKLACSQAGPGGGAACTGSPDSPDCEGYCTLYAAACGGDSHNPFMGQLPNDNAGSKSECIEKCTAIQPATDPKLNTGYTWDDGSRSGDNLACRLYYVSAAVVDPMQANCDRAGIRPYDECLGAGVAPSCDNFCLALTTACHDDDLKVYESNSQCLAVCKATDSGKKQNTEEINTIGCRTAHVFNALLIDPIAHCPHVSALGAGVCGKSADGVVGGNCAAYCDLVEKACHDGFTSHYENMPDCADQCSKINGADANYSVTLATAGGDNLLCRTLFVSKALDALSKPLAKPDDAADFCKAVFGGDPCSDE